MNTELSGVQLAQGSANAEAAPAAEAVPAAAETPVAEHAAAETHSEVGHEAGGAASALPPFLRFDPGVWIWTTVVFVLLLLILRKMAWGPIISSLEEREKTIKDSLDQAAKIQAESLRITEEQNKILAAGFG
jgi:hypothetical protein